jgi:hypothetical protein
MPLVSGLRRLRWEDPWGTGVQDQPELHTFISKKKYELSNIFVWKGSVFNIYHKFHKFNMFQIFMTYITKKSTAGYDGARI